MKKPSQPRWPFLGPWSPDGDGEPRGLGASVEEVEPLVLPGLEQLRPMGRGELRQMLGDPAEARGGRRRTIQLTARIVDDSLDGDRVFASPPLRPHPVSRIRRLVGRMGPGVWLAMAIATLASASLLAEASPTHWTPGVLVEFGLRLVGMASLALLPAAVLLWRPDAWRSARAVLVGAVVWGTVPALAYLAWAPTRHSAGLGAAYGPAMSTVLAVASLAACCGPAIVAFGLDRARHAHESEFRYLAVRAALASVCCVGLSAVQWDPSQAKTVLPAQMPGDPAPFLVLLRGATLPIEIASLVLLAYVCFSAVIDESPQPTLWRLNSLAAGLLILASSWEIVSVGLFGNSWMPALGLQDDAWGPLMAIAEVAGPCLLLAGFSSPVWSLARDAAPGLGAPEEVFAWGSAADATGDMEIPIGNVVAVSAGADHALAVDDQGRVAAWGDDSAGQTTVPMGLRDVRAVAAGDRFSLALRADGTIAAWGSNDLDQSSPPADLTDAAAICAGADFGLALRADGTVLAWGNRASPAIDVPADLRGVVGIAAGKRHALALRHDGSVIAWGDNELAQLRPPVRLSGVTAISAGGDFCLALRSDGSVVAWGDNTYGQLEVPPTLSGVVAIAAGAFHGVALCKTGAVVSWGSGRPLGEGSHPWRLLDFRAVAAGHEYTLAIRAA